MFHYAVFVFFRFFVFFSSTPGLQLADSRGVMSLCGLGGGGGGKKERRD